MLQRSPSRARSCSRGSSDSISLFVALFISMVSLVNALASMPQPIIFITVKQFANCCRARGFLLNGTYTQ